MQKKWIVRIAFFGLILTLVTTLVLTGTLAKYITTSTGTDSADVAAFGVSVNIAESGVDEYQPGVATEMLIEFTGTPEVAVTLSFSTANSAGYSTNWKVSSVGAGYFPLVFAATLQQNVDDDGVNVDDDWVDVDVDLVAEGLQKIATAADFATLQSALNAFTWNFAADTDLSVYRVVIDWAWPFNGGNDAADTYIASLGSDATFGIEVDVTVTQTAS